MNCVLVVYFINSELELNSIEEAKPWSRAPAHFIGTSEVKDFFPSSSESSLCLQWRSVVVSHHLHRRRPLAHIFNGHHPTYILKLSCDALLIVSSFTWFTTVLMGQTAYALRRWIWWEPYKGKFSKHVRLPKAYVAVDINSRWFCRSYPHFAKTLLWLTPHFIQQIAIGT